LPPRDRAAVNKLLKYASDGPPRSNFILRTVDLSESMDEATRALWEARPGAELPWMVVRCPGASRGGEHIWAGRLSLRAVDDLLDSPARREIARRILGGESAVWVLLEGGDGESDEAAAELLEAKLREMERTLKLPVPARYGTGDAPDDQGDPGLRIAFSMVRLSRTDPSERVLVSMLLHSEPDLEAYPEPMAFPIFGRGRILYALVGDGINGDNIREACSFIVGACSCQVKDLSPGADLLMSVDWDSVVGDGGGGEISPIVGLSEFVRGMEAADRDSAAAGRAVGEMADRGRGGETPGTLGRNLLIVMLAGLSAVAIATCILRLGRR